MKQSVIRIAYVLAVAAPLAMGWLVVSGQIWSLMRLKLPPSFQVFVTIITVMSGVLVAAMGAVFLYLAYRPRWWGKIICLFPAVSWLGFSVMSGAMGPPNPVRWVPAAAGALLLLVASVHHLTDRSLGPFGPAKGSGTGGKVS